MFPVDTACCANLTSPPRPRFCTRAETDGCHLHLPLLLSSGRTRTGGGDDRLKRSQTLNLRVMACCWSSLRYETSACPDPCRVNWALAASPAFDHAAARPEMKCHFHHSVWRRSLSLIFQTEITFTAKEPLRGSYVAVVHYRQPEHTSFPVDVRVTTEQSWKGECWRGSARLPSYEGFTLEILMRQNSSYSGGEEEIHPLCDGDTSLWAD